MLEIIIADDDTYAQGGMAFFLSTLANIKIVSTVENGNDVLERAKDYPKASIILDMGLPGRHGLDVLRDLKNGPYENPVIVLTGLSAHDLLKDCIEAGADAVMTKSDNETDLYHAFDAIKNETQYIGGAVRKSLQTLTKEEDNIYERAFLTEREKQIMLAIADGLTATEIAEKMCIAASTVRKHRENLMAKTGCHNAADITSYVLKRGLHIVSS